MIRELLEDYVLGELSPHDRRRVEEHLGECAACRMLAGEYENALQSLSEALAVVSPLTLPSNLKTSLLARIEHETAAAARPERARAPWFGLKRAGVLVGTVLLVLSIASTVAFAVTLERQRDLRGRLAEFVEDQELVLELTDGRGRRKLSLRAPDPDSRAYGKVFTHPHLREVLVMANRLPRPKARLGYQVWVTSDRKTWLVGALELNQKGFGAFIFTGDRLGPTYDDVRVVLQPKGSKTPPGERAPEYLRASRRE